MDQDLSDLIPSSLTIKVDVSILVEVDVGEDLLQLTFLQLLPQQVLHAVLQLIHGDLSITITVKLVTGKKSPREMQERRLEA